MKFNELCNNLKSGKKVTATHKVTGNQYNLEYTDFVLLLDGLAPIGYLDLIRWYDLDVTAIEVSITKEQALLIEMLITNGDLYPSEKRELFSFREQLKLCQ